ncbi:restriction endonuclease subunit R [Coleofasciculus sp. F4-SAH-05]|uniref:restriction endonuclease subunit R n=1 Tax=Coleofasciculus sp. F4-SAH-05 TaxID=3069525 RepID=UPI0032F8A5D4
MAQVIQASELTLHDVENKFNLQQVEDEQFFGEWQGKLPELTTDQKEWLDQVKADFLALEKYPVHEEIVKMVVLSPLLSLAGLFRYPFRPVAEKQVEIVVEEKDEVVRGRIDVLVLHQQLWVTVIESKSKRFSLSEALPQALFYMLNSPNTWLFRTCYAKLHQNTPKIFAKQGFWALFRVNLDCGGIKSRYN